MNDDPLEKLYDLLKDFNTAMLITMGGPDSCHARPMAIAKVDENTGLWLFTARDSEKVREIEADSRVQVHCQEGWTNCVFLAGSATVVADRAVIREIWKPSFKAWCRDGAEDPNIVLLHMIGEHAEYWDSTGAYSFRHAYQSL